MIRTNDDTNRAAMDDERRRGLIWKIGLKNGNADQLDRIREFVEVVHDALERIHLSHVVAVAREVSQEPDEEKKGYIEMYHADEGSKFGIEFPAMASAATFVSIMSYLEHEMFWLCARLQKNKKYSLGVKELSGSGIEQAANYLEKVCGIQDIRTAPAWNDINKLQKIRNIVVHRRGMLNEIDGKNDPERDVRRYAFEKGLLADALGSELLLTKDFCIEAVEAVKRMLWILVDRVPGADLAGEEPS